MWLKIFLDDEVLELGNAMARHLPARLHLDCPTVQSVAYALSGDVTPKALYVAMVALDQGVWPKKTIFTERLPEFWPELETLADRLGATVGDVYQVALSRAVWMVSKPPRWLTRGAAAAVLGTSRSRVMDWEEAGLIPRAFGSGMPAVFPEPMIEGVLEVRPWWRSQKKREEYLARLEELAFAARTERYGKEDR